MLKIVIALGSIFVGTTFAFRFHRNQRKKRSSRTSKKEKTAAVTKGESSIGIIGDIFMDVVVGGIQKIPDWGMDELTESPIKLMPGGGGLNSALILGGLQQAFGSNSSVQLHSLIGYDQFGDVVRKRVHGTRVNLIYTEGAARRVSTGICVCFSGGKEGKMDRAFITYRGAMATFNEKDLDIDQLQKVSHVHIAGYYNFPKMWSALNSTIVPALKMKNITVSCNPQWDESQEWKGLPDLYSDLDYLIMNEDEAFQLTRQAKLGDALEKFHSQGLKMAIVTIGAKGAVASICEYHNSGEDGKKRSPPVIRWYWHKANVVAEVVDTTGAGDAFTGGYLHEWSRSRDVRKALQIGCAVGSAMVTKLGASASLTLDDIRGYMCDDCLSEESAPSNSILQHISINPE